MIPPVCVCLSAGYITKLLTDLIHILWNYRSLAKDLLIRFWDRSRSGPVSRVNFSISPTWKDRTFLDIK